jgi:hypothetical protein
MMVTTNSMNICFHPIVAQGSRTGSRGMLPASVREAGSRSPSPYTALLRWLGVAAGRPVVPSSEPIVLRSDVLRDTMSAVASGLGRGTRPRACSDHLTDLAYGSGEGRSGICLS